MQGNRSAVLGTRQVHVWLADLHARGGIPLYSSILLRTMLRDLPQSSFTVIVKNDPRDADSDGRHDRLTIKRLAPWPARLRTAAFAARVAYEELRSRPALVFCGHINFTPAAYRLKQLAGIPYWTMAHGIDAWNIEKHSIRRALANADRIVAVSQYTANRIAIEQGIAPDRISILPNTCDPNVYRPGPKPGYLFQRYGLPPNARVIMTVARLDASERYKGYDQVIRALPTVLQHVPEAHYLLVGRGSDRARIERLIEHEGVSGRVTLAGFVSDDELPDHYRLCDVFVMPSRNEGFGIVYLEAMACGKPVVAGNRDGSVDPLCGGELGVLVDPDDVGEIAEATIEILRGTHPLAVLRQPDELRQRTIDRFGPQAFAEQLQAIWTEHFPNSRSHPLVSKTVDQSH